MVRVPTKLRNIELEALDGCFMALSTNCQSIPEYLQCLRVMETFQHLPDNVMTVNMKKSDVENVMNGFKLTAGKRPESWTRARSFWEQIISPKELEIEEPKVA
jgi:hypothetical protein